MNPLLEQLSMCVESGKISKTSPFPASLRGQDGADELTRQALEQGIAPSMILQDALIPAMSRVGEKFSQGKAFVPEMLVAAKAMSAAMKHLKPFIASGQLLRKGVFVIGTVAGDLHEIGKNIVAMTMEGAGWEVVDLGVDVRTEKFLESIARHPGCIVGLSALLTTTMPSMEATVKAIKQQYPSSTVLIGGAPLNQDFCTRIGADFFSPDPQGAVTYLDSRAAS